MVVSTSMNKCMTRCSAKARCIAPNGCKHSVDKVLQWTNAWKDAVQNTVAGTVCMQHFQHPIEESIHNTMSHLSLPSPTQSKDEKPCKEGSKRQAKQHSYPLKRAQTCAQETPRWAPKVMGRPKIEVKGVKLAPRCSQEAPDGGQEAPKTP